MTIDQLAYALAVQQYQSFVKAAEHVFVTQPALTIQIRNLEEELGITLFDRSKKPLLITEEGEIFLKKAQEILIGFRDLEQIAQQLSKNFEGEVRLGVIATLAPYLLPLFIRQLQEAYPGIRLHVAELITEEIILGIKNGTLDAGIIATPVSAKGLLQEVLFYEKFYLYVSRQHALYAQEQVAIGEVPAKDVWLLREGNCFRNQINDLCSIDQMGPGKTDFTYLSSSIESLQRIVDHQGGLTFVPELATLSIPAEKEDMIKDIAGTQPVREISLVTHRAYVKEKLLGKIKEVLEQNIPFAMKELAGKTVVDTNIRV